MHNFEYPGQVYPKIQTVFKRDPDTHKILEHEYSTPEFKYLAKNDWVWTEKIDGTNIRIEWLCSNDDAYGERDSDSPPKLQFRGRTLAAQIPPKLLAALEAKFLNQTVLDLFESKFGETAVCLYGEGYGAGIQKGGGNYRSDCGFVLFDVFIGGFWLQRDANFSANNIEDIAKTFDLDIVPIVTVGSLLYGVDLVKQDIKSAWGNFPAEGLVGKPLVDLFNRRGERVITKIKTSDF